MVALINKELIGSPHKTLIKGNLFDFIKKRENMNLCGSEKSVLKPFFRVGNF
ncbi:Hypothetical protein A9601_07781 [Prochlorococcus marinus str. AS9601]|uniref:Uncharacterized protein n=1 Tax=Prochlorococcus marinus (strain AS9601) TaxID=146891 RepID=A2BQK3_PROMS|nr:Hypothetical protein A9601_07781 [Prochlorococcus marinus str. AS9601]